jgi:ribosomal protein S18 acetylase RimI-like enzyme
MESLRTDIDVRNVHITPLRPDDHRRRGFCCRVEKIQNYVRNNIRKQHEDYQVRAFVACYEASPDIIGFYYLCLTSYALATIDDSSDRKFGRVDAIPAVYLGMLAVDREYAGCGIGSMLMLHAMHTTAAIAARAGTYALTLDALDDTLVAFYKRFDFRTFKEGRTGLEMFLPLKVILAALAARIPSQPFPPQSEAAPAGLTLVTTTGAFPDRR